MKIFFSHSSRQKPLVREIRNLLPRFLASWVDEDRLFIGNEIDTTIQAAINSDVDYVLLFIDEHAAKSTWVRREVEWTIEAERRHNRTILLPVVIDRNAYDDMAAAGGFRGRKYLDVTKFDNASVRAFAESLVTELFALVCDDLEHTRGRRASPALATIVDADKILRRHAEIIEAAVFPHRRKNPIRRDQLLGAINSYQPKPLSEDDLDVILTEIGRRNLAPGLAYDGHSAYLIEEHAVWKRELRHSRKARIGRKAAELLENETKVFLDAGSTTDEVAEIICKRITNRVLTDIFIATTSIGIAGAITDCCVRMGFDDSSKVKLLVPGGRIRPSTRAVVAANDGVASDISSLSDAIGGFDMALVGVNGVDAEGGFTTHAKPEADNKAAIIRASKKSVVVGDSSKIGLVLERKFADFSDNIVFLVDDDPGNGKLVSLMAAHGKKIMLA